MALKPAPKPAPKAKIIQTKVQTKVKILVGLCRNLAGKRFNDPDRWDEIGTSDAISIYFPAGDPALTAYTAELDDEPPFVGDGITFDPHDFAGSQKVSELFDDIVGRYKKSGFTLV